ncbi:MAG: FtsQ-type POTRA domain-containing protein [Lachnospiraceae bacterium]|nr:FtsQ-type POTRA domain-containing protein [Lachnospiraceae bacterium]
MMKEKKKQRKSGNGHKKVVLFFSILVVFVLLAAALLYIESTYKIRNVYVDGNVHYTDEEIMDIVMAGPLGDNSVFLSLKYKKKGIDDIPFVQTMDVAILSPDTIRITVYEKSLAGYVEYLGNYMYFDKDGTIVESSTSKTVGIPQVTGLVFQYVVMYEPLPVEDKEVFETILDMTQLLNKYSLSADRLYFDSNYEMTIYFENVKAAVGAGDNIDEKVMLLQSILPDLEGKSGTIHLENYTEDTKNVTFEPD